MVMPEPIFLALDEVVALHGDQIDRYGGSHGVRDLGGLESAIAQPRASFDGHYLHGDLWSMAAAYLYHLVQNHPFIDGNKRVGLVSALVFLELNGIGIRAEPDQLADLVFDVAQGKVHKDGIVAFLLRNAADRSS